MGTIQCRVSLGTPAITWRDIPPDTVTRWRQKTHRVSLADPTEYRVRDKYHRVSRKVTEYSHILTEYLTELFHRVHWVRSRFLFSHRVFGRKLTEFTEFTRSRVFSPSSRPREFPRVTVPGGICHKWKGHFFRYATQRPRVPTYEIVPNAGNIGHIFTIIWGNLLITNIKIKLMARWKA